MNEIECKKCHRMVPDDKKSMWEHALKFHTDAVIQNVVERAKVAPDPSSLYHIGFKFGQQMKKDDITLINAVWNIAKGIGRYGKNH